MTFSKYSPDEEDEDDCKEDQLFNGAAQSQMLTLAGAGDPTLALDHHDRLLPFFDPPENCKSSFNHCFKCFIINKAFFDAPEKASHCSIIVLTA